MKKKKIIFIAAAVMAAAMIYAYTEYNRGVKDLAHVDAKENITSTDLMQQFRKDELIANEKFLGKVVEVQGFIRDVEIDDKGYLTVVLGDSTDAMSGVRCAMDSSHKLTGQELVKGMVVSIKGNFTGYQADETGLPGTDAHLNRCVINTDNY